MAVKAAYEIPNLRFSLMAAAAVARRRFVKVNTDGEGLQAGAGEAAVGVSMQPTTAAGEVLELADGIVIVEAGAAVNAQASIQSDASGRAITRTTGIVLGTALTTATAAGQLIAVKSYGIAVGPDAYNRQAITYTQQSLTAGNDVASVPFYAVPTGYKFTVLSAYIVAQGSSSGIDDSNTSVVAIKVGSDTVASKTYNTTVTFPASGTSDSLGTITNADVAAGEVLTVSITNGATAATPGVVVQINGIYETV